ncbi:MAG: class I SAM-dependent methyltransferase [Nitrospirae bacterium]|nr:class I SAM-dependent methyltransferase [Nitrospirota bacterium]
MACRICNSFTEEVLNLGLTPPANSLLDSSLAVQQTFPLVLELCESCYNVQLRDCLSSEELYLKYLYITPESTMLTRHYRYLYGYLESSGYIKKESFVVEVGSNVGLFLKFIRNKVSRVVGIDPAENICKIANEAGVDTICDFFNSESALIIRDQYGVPDIIIARHCFAHNSNPHVLMKGVTTLLSDSGYLVIENSYLLNTIENNEFDQVYHEHMFYYSIRSMMALLNIHGLRLIDVMTSLIHGGSIVFVAKRENDGIIINPSVNEYLECEQMFINRQSLKNFADKAYEIRGQIGKLIKNLRNTGKTIYTYGATAKGNTLLNFVGLTCNEIPLCIDSTPGKQGKYLPQSYIKVIPEDEGLLNPPDYFLLTAWNYRDEIINKVREAGNYHSKFIIPIPFVHIV